MNFNIAIGQYYPTDSYIHKLDSRVKLIGTLNFIIVLFIANNIWAYALSALFLFTVIFISNIPPIYIIRGLKNIVFIILFTVLLNIIFVKGEREIFSIWILSITVEGIITALEIGSRLTMLIISSSILTLTTSPIQLTNAIESLFKPFKRVGVPVHEIAMMMTIALRFIPTLMEESDKIMKAQMARGATFDTGSIIKKAKSLIPILVPLFVSSFRRADDLAMAMESRCYRGDINRTRMNILKYKLNDYIAMLCLLMFTIIIILIRVLLN